MSEHPSWDSTLPREGWLFFAVGPPVLTVLLNPHLFTSTAHENLFACLAVYLYSTGCGGATHGLCDVVLPRVLPVVASTRWRVLITAAWVGAGAVAVTMLLRPWLAVLDPGMGVRFWRLASKGIIVSLLYVAVAHGFKHLRQRIQSEQRRAESERVAALEARLAALQARTNPHFLFNSLNVVMSLIATDPNLAEETLARLASIYRYALEGAERRVVLLQQEVDAVRDYLEVEKARFGDRLRYQITVDPDALVVSLPPMLLQPLVENAVLHGINQRVEGGQVTVTIRRTQRTVVVTVYDDGPGPNGSSHRGSGTGLRTIRERLRLTYGPGAELTTGHAPGGGFAARLQVTPP